LKKLVKIYEEFEKKQEKTLDELNSSDEKGGE